jgi:glycosyltransferase involved in cell wall biosynthesis
VNTIVCVNSTLAGQAALIARGVVSPIHGWGFDGTSADRVFAHGRSRLEVLLRSRFEGFDLRVTARLAIALLRGHRGVYLVTPLDVLRAVPLLTRLFPRARFVTWIWTADDVPRYRPLLERCFHVFCLTDGAFTALEQAGLGEHGSLQIWGTDPRYYACDDWPEAQYDVALLGLTHRDLELATRAAAATGLKVVTTEEGLRAAGWGTDGSRGSAAAFAVVKPAAHEEVVRIFQRSRVSWIPLRAGDRQPTGYTNLAESLLAGTPVVIGDSSTLPREVLALPGVFRYRVGELASLVDETRRALAAGAAGPAYRRSIRLAASRLLNGAALRNSLANLLR